MMDAAEFIEPFARLLDEVASPAAVRAVERGGAPQAMWDAVNASGYLDALIGEDAGGAGLPPLVVQALLQEVGRRAVPLPIGETMAARALLSAAGQAVPDGPIVLAVATHPSGAVTVPLGLVAQHILVESAAGRYLCNAERGAPQPTGVFGDLSARFHLDGQGATDAFEAPPHGLRACAALVRSALIAGAADQLVQASGDYAAQRVQFGKPIGRQQVLQQNLAVMAEQAVAARLASQLGWAAGFPATLAGAATAKSVSSTAAAMVANMAHAIHGAIGISEEYDLQLLTRRLHEWRLADGSESYWNRLLGAERLKAGGGSVDFVRHAIGVSANMA